MYITLFYHSTADSILQSFFPCITVTNTQYTQKRYAVKGDSGYSSQDTHMSDVVSEFNPEVILLGPQVKHLFDKVNERYDTQYTQKRYAVKGDSGYSSQVCIPAGPEDGGHHIQEALQGEVGREGAAEAASFSGFQFTFLGTAGMFLAMITAILSVEIYAWAIRKTDRLPQIRTICQVPPEAPGVPGK